MPLWSHNIWKDRILLIIGLLIATFIGVFHVAHIYYRYRMRKIQTQMEEMSSTQSSTPPTVTATQNKMSKSTPFRYDKYKMINGILTASMLTFTFAYQLHDLLNLFGIPYQWFGFVTDCGVWPNLAAVMWHTAKCSIYNIYVLRMKVSFKGSAYEYSNNVLYVLCILFNLYWVYAVFGDMTEIYGSYEYIPSEDTYWCQFHFALWGMIVTGTIDTILSMICLSLFLKPLITVLRNSEGMKGNADSNELEDFIIKYFLLSLIAIASTGLWVLCVVLQTNFGAIVGVDSSLNALSVFLMFGAYKKYYFLLCTPCHNIFKKCKRKAVGTEIDDVDL